MKILTLTLACILLVSSCNEDEVTPIAIAEETMIGRWHLVGFETTVMYQFTENLRYTIYSEDGNFGGLETAIPNPLNWYWDNDQVVIDLNFGNESRLVPSFKCEGQVIDWYDVNDEFFGTYIRETYDIETCTE